MQSFHHLFSFQLSQYSHATINDKSIFIPLCIVKALFLLMRHRKSEHTQKKKGMMKGKKRKFYGWVSSFIRSAHIDSHTHFQFAPFFTYLLLYSLLDLDSLPWGSRRCFCMSLYKIMCYIKVGTMEMNMFQRNLASLKSIGVKFQKL